MKKVLAVALITVIMLAGCNFADRSQTVVSQHLSEPAERTGGEMRVENYAGLKNAILRIVETGEPSGVIRMYNYAGDAPGDLTAACREIMTEDPLGAFAVAYMLPECVRVLAYYEATVTVSYRRTPEQIAAIVELQNTRELDAELASLCLDFGTELTADMPYYNYEVQDIERTIAATRNANPLAMPFLPDVSVTLYPETGLRRIAEYKLTYPLSADEMSGMVRDAESRVADIIGALDRELTGEELIRAIADELIAAVRYLPGREDDLEGVVVRDSTFTAYGALVEGEAASEGYALALKGLLDAAGIESRVVSGRHDGVAHVWNLVRVGDDWYHADAALCELYGDASYMLKTDEEVGEALKWNTASYPAADGESLEPAAVETEDIEA